MHAWECILKDVRTTIEIPDDLRQRLVVEAARTGVRGYSAIVEAALRAFFAGEVREERAREVHDLFGSDVGLSVDLGDAASTRDSWRTGR